MVKKPITFHLLQFASVYLEPLKTLHRLETLLEGLSPGRGDWVVLPEMWASGFRQDHAKRLIKENSLCFRWLRDYSLSHRCYMAGSMLEMNRGKAFNSTFLIDQKGKLKTRYRKIHLLRLTGEHRHYEPGNKIKITNLAWGRVGWAICFDLRFPELFRQLVSGGAKVILVPSAWPKERLDHMLTLLKARAIENHCFMVGVNKVGKEKDGMVYGGHSVVFDPWGNNLGELKNRRGILSVQINPGTVDKIRKQYPFLKSRVLS